MVLLFFIVQIFIKTTFFCLDVITGRKISMSIQILLADMIDYRSTTLYDF